VLDSKVANGGKPLTFQQGQYNIFKCWDLSVMFLQATERISMYCPSYLANGGATTYSQLGSTPIPANTPMYFDIQVVECQAKLEDMLSIGRKFFKPVSDSIIGSGLQNFTGSGAYDKSGNLRRNGGGPPPQYEHAVSDENAKTDKAIGDIQNEVNQLSKDVEKLSNDLTKKQEEARTEDLEPDQVDALVKTEGKLHEAKANYKRGVDKINKLKAKKAAAAKLVAESSDPKDEEDALKTAKKASTSGKKEAAIQKAKIAKDVLLKKNEKKAAKKAQGKLLSSKKCLRLASMTN
jgi:hypothetical protein